MTVQEDHDYCQWVRISCPKRLKYVEDVFSVKDF